MYKHLVSVLIMLLALTSSAQQTIPSGPAPDGLKGAAVNITSSTATGVYYISPASANNIVELKRGAALVGTLYHCAVLAADLDANGAVDTSAKCTSITSLSADTTLTVTNPSRYFVIDIDTTESGSNVSYLTIRGAQTAGVPSLSGPSNLTSNGLERPGGTLGYPSLPAATVFGHGISMEGTPGFSAAKYPGGAAGQGSEPNNMMGWFYNKTGVLPSGASSVLNLSEPSMDFSWEFGYRSTSNTQDETWWELNWDIWPADFTTTTTGGAAGTFQAGDRFSCSGGGSGYVVAYPSANNLTMRQDWGQCAAGEVATNQTAPRVGNTATLGTLNYTQSNYFRPMIWGYKQLQNTAFFEFNSFPNDNTVSISAGYLRHHGRIVPGTVAAGTSTLATGSITAGNCAAVVTTAASGTLTTDVIRWTPQVDISAVTGFGPTGGGLVIYSYPTANNVNFKVCNPTAGSLTPGSAVVINWMVDRWL